MFLIHLALLWCVQSVSAADDPSASSSCTSIEGSCQASFFHTPTRVARIAVPDAGITRAFLAKLCEEDRPVVIEDGGAALQWSAMQKWADIDYLRDHIPGLLENVKRMPAADSEYMFPSDMPLANHRKLLNGWHPHFSRHNYTVDEFVQLAGIAAGSAAPADYKLKYDAHFSAWGSDLAADANTRKLVPDPLPTLQHTIHEPYLWWGSAGAVTPMHYDNFANFYVQISGRKEFLLAAPEQARRVVVQPALHPAHRSAQVNPAGALSDIVEQQARRMQRHFGGIPLMNATLAAGDILFIPAMWFHHVTALTSALSLNVWTGYRATFLAEQAAAAAASLLGQELRDLPQNQLVQGLRVLLSMILDEVNADWQPLAEAGDADEAGFERQALSSLPPDARRLRIAGQLLSRLRYLNVGASQAPPAALYCNDDTAFSELVSQGGFAVYALNSAFEAVTPLLKEAQQVTTTARYETLVLNVLERVAVALLSPFEVPAFVHALAVC